MHAGIHTGNARSHTVRTDVQSRITDNFKKFVVYSSSSRLVVESSVTMDSLLVSSDEKVRHVPNLDLAQKIYLLEKKPKNNAELVDKILKDLEADNMLPLYQHLCEKFGWVVDGQLLAKMTAENEKDLNNIEMKRSEAKQNAGDMEVLDAMFEKARFYSRTGYWADANSAFDEILKLEKLSTGKRIDATLDKARIALFIQDVRQLRELISRAKKLVDLGGDWDRRNRLKVYEALYLLSIRDIKPASLLFMDCIATFTCVELCSYNTFMFYAILTGILSLDRIELKTKIIANPQVISVIRDLPKAAKLLNALYACNYSSFIRALLDVSEDIIDDRYMGPHATYIVREYRVLGYSQFLEAYKSVMLSSMALSFGISVALLDEELSRFIAAGRLNAKIDKVGDVIETSRPDKKNAQYQDVIKKGDVLLNQIQKLVRAIDV